MCPVPPHAGPRPPQQRRSRVARCRAVGTQRHGRIHPNCCRFIVCVLCPLDVGRQHGAFTQMLESVHRHSRFVREVRERLFSLKPTCIRCDTGCIGLRRVRALQRIMESRHFLLSRSGEDSARTSGSRDGRRLELRPLSYILFWTRCSVVQARRHKLTCVQSLNLDDRFDHRDVIERGAAIHRGHSPQALSADRIDHGAADRLDRSRASGVHALDVRRARWRERDHGDACPADRRRYVVGWHIRGLRAAHRRPATVSVQQRVRHRCHRVRHMTGPR